jgi:syntaxin 16
MATRSRTQLFIQYRQSFLRSKPNFYEHKTESEKIGLITQTEGKAAMIDMSSLPPSWVDTVRDVSFYIRDKAD